MKIIVITPPAQVAATASCLPRPTLIIFDQETNPLAIIPDVTTKIATKEATHFLETTELRSHAKQEAFRKAMDHYWNASQELQKLCPLVVAELNREIDAL